MELFLIYVWLKINSIITMAQIATVFLGFGALGFFISAAIDEDIYGAIPSVPIHRKLAKKLAAWAIGCAVIWGVVPDKTDIAILVGASYALDLARSPEGQKVQTLIRGKANQMLDEELKKLEK
jgi:hypothetical protein